MMKENYQLIDCGDRRKLEKFGNYIVDRPALTANWDKSLDGSIWKQADFIFNKDSGWNKSLTSEKDFVFKWKNIVLKLQLTENGQLGVFPEHFLNWKLIFNCLKKEKNELNILNGFAYTGAATIAVSLLHNEDRKINVTHLDSSKPVINKAKENATLSAVKNNPIRWIQDDLVTFMEKEIKRNKKYNGIILDPPAFGRGKGRKTWKLKTHLPYLIELCEKLMDKENPVLFILSCHDKSVSLSNLQQLIAQINFNFKGKFSKLNMVIPSKHGNSLPAGISVSWNA